MAVPDQHLAPRPLNRSARGAAGRAACTKLSAPHQGPIGATQGHKFWIFLSAIYWSFIRFLIVCTLSVLLYIFVYI